MSMSRSISLRLDEESAAALRILERSGMRRSDAIRHALRVAAAQRELREELRAEAQRVAGDGADRQEKAAVTAALDEVSDPW
jgi:antitoxin component of RelBE/YafQ-DinJ toxin-antitoxin module